MIESRNEFTALPLAQRALLWCMRMWAMQLRWGADTHGRADDMLGKLGAPTASRHLERLMAMVVHGTTRELELLCVCQTEVAADERALLDVMSLAQAKRSLEAFLLLRSVMPTERAGAALQIAEDIGAILAGAGRSLPAPDEDVHRFEQVPSPLPTRLVHAALH